MHSTVHVQSRAGPDARFPSSLHPPRTRQFYFCPKKELQAKKHTNRGIDMHTPRGGQTKGHCPCQWVGIAAKEALFVKRLSRESGLT
jgi:hypothetical protein